MQGEGPHVGQSTLVRALRRVRPALPLVRLAAHLAARHASAASSCAGARASTASSRIRSRSPDALAACEALELAGAPLREPDRGRAAAPAGGRGRARARAARPRAAHPARDPRRSRPRRSSRWSTRSTSSRWTGSSRATCGAPRIPAAARVEPFHAAHERFLRVARRAPEVVVKLVVTPASEDAEIDEAAARIAGVDPERDARPAAGDARPAPCARRRARSACSRSSCGSRARCPDVRLIPQTHKQIGVP